jgi:acyl-homoserine-lactone acylase
MEDPVRALTESFTRTKAKNYREFRETVNLRTNSSNNTVYADADGNIAYFQASFVPKRDPKFDWNRPVDGSDSATDWKGVLTLDEMPNVLNPPNGWIQNTNNWPYSAAGENSPKQNDFPRYVDTYGENPRGIHAMRLLEGKKDFSLQGLIDAAYDSYQPTFAVLVPPLIKDYDALPASSPLKSKLAEQVKVLGGWDYRWSAESVPTALAIYWAEDLWKRVPQNANDEELQGWEYVAKKATADERLESLAAASDKLAQDFGTWKTPWGEINRFQRLTDDIVHRFSDSAPSIPVPFTTAQWGSLASIVPQANSGTEEALRQVREQLRRGDRVRRFGPGPGGDRRGRERRPQVQALQRSGGAVQQRRLAGGVFLSGHSSRGIRTGVSPGGVRTRHGAVHPRPTTPSGTPAPRARLQITKTSTSPPRSPRCADHESRSRFR